MKSFIRSMLLGVVAYLLAACNYTEPGTCTVGGGGFHGGQGGGIITPGQGAGGLGDAPPAPQGAGDTSDPCNAVEGRNWTCNGVVNCHKDGHLRQCEYRNYEKAAQAPGEAVALLVEGCQDSNAGYSCSQNTLTCGDAPVATPAASRFICNGGVSCTDAKGYSDGCSYSGEEVYADDAADAVDSLVEVCEIEMHDKYGNNCDHGGMCCTAGSLTCNKA